MLTLGLLGLIFIALPVGAAAQNKNLYEELREIQEEDKSRTPAQKQYDGGVPNASGGSDTPGGQGVGGKGRGKKDDGAAKDGKGKKGKKKAAGTTGETGETGELTSLESDDGGLSTLAIILIVLAVIAGAALAYVWWRGREVGGGPEPPAP